MRKTFHDKLDKALDILEDQAHPHQNKGAGQITGINLPITADYADDSSQEESEHTSDYDEYEDEEEEHSFNYEDGVGITPDKIIQFATEGETLIHFPNGKTIRADLTTWHYDMATKTWPAIKPLFVAKYPHNEWPDDITTTPHSQLYGKIRRILDKVLLMARTDADRQILAIWDDPNDQLQEFVASELKNGHIDQDWVVTVGGSDPVSVTDILQGAETTPADDLEDQRQIHMARDPMAKAALRKKFGVEKPPRRPDWTPEPERRSKYWATSEGAEPFADVELAPEEYKYKNELEELLDKGFTPDDLYSLSDFDSMYAFYYASDGVLFGGQGTTIHNQILRQGEVMRHVMALAAERGEEITGRYPRALRNVAEVVGVCGRVVYSDGVCLVAFWEDLFVREALEELVRKQVVGEDAFVSVRGSRPVRSVGDWLGGGQGEVVGADDVDERKALHVAGPGAREALRAKFGVVKPPRRPDWSPEPVRRGRYWATSEDVGG